MNVHTDLVGCARCGSDHSHLILLPLTNPIQLPGSAVTLTHWAPCPTNGEPILSAVAADVLAGANAEAA